MRMSGRTLKNLVAALLVSSLGLALGLPADGRLILCVGADGHVDISLVLSPANARTDSRLAAEGSFHHDHHGECDDTELDLRGVDGENLAFSGSPDLPSRRAGAPRPFELIRPCADPAAGNPSPFPGTGLRPARPATRLAPLRTTVLLI